MEVFTFILILIFLVISGIKALISESDIFEMIVFMITFLLCIISLAYESSQLRDKDVLNGKAEYVETIHISKGDTIKTYHIQRKEK